MRTPGPPARGARAGRRKARWEHPPWARPRRGGSPGPIPNPAVKPPIAESTAEEVRGRAGRRAHGGCFPTASKARRPRGAERSPAASVFSRLLDLLGSLAHGFFLRLQWRTREVGLSDAPDNKRMRSGMSECERLTYSVRSMRPDGRSQRILAQVNWSTQNTRSGRSGEVKSQ